MKINCISCGHNFSLDDAYEDFVGMVKCCVCGAMLSLKAAEGKIQAVELAVIQHPPQQHSKREPHGESDTREY